VVAKVEWHPRELYPRVGFIVTNMTRPVERVVAFYNKRGTCEQWIKEGKGAIKWTRLSCRTFAANAVRLQLHALAHNLGNFLRTLATPEPIKDWSLTTLKDKLIKIGAKVVSHGRYVIFQMAEAAIPRQMFQEILQLIAELRPQPPPAPSVRRSMSCIQEQPTEGVCPNAREKWPDQTLDQAFGLPEVLVAVGTSRLSCKRAGKTRTLMPVWDSSGESRLKAQEEVGSRSLS
jgi:hypothetical protein